MKTFLRTKLKEALVPLIYRYPPFGLQPERMATYLSGLLERRDVPGDVAEIGCNLGGTAAIAARMLKRMGWTGRYVCFDTFGGFVQEQFAKDVARGTSSNRQSMFDANSTALVRKILKRHDASQVELVQGDITKVADHLLSPKYMAVLLDIDLADPTYEALHRFWPRLSPGGIIYVDDCPENYEWKARVGYQRFCQDIGVAEEYSYGLGIVQKPI
jgi:O-methyltransferase